MSQTKKITEGAMIVAIIGVILVLNRTLGNLLEFGFMWILSLPIIIYTSKYGFKFGSIVAISTFILAFILGSTFSTMFYVFVEMLIGVGYGIGVFKKYSNKLMLSYTMIIEIISMFLSISIFASLLGYDVVQETKTISDFLCNINSNLNVKGIILILFLITPIFTALGEGCCIHCFTHLLCSKMNIEIEPLKPLYEFNVSRSIGIFSIVIMIIYCVFITLGVEGIFLYIIAFIMLSLFIVVVVKGISQLTYQSKGNKIKIFLILITSIIPVINFYHYIIGLTKIFKE